MICAQCRKQIKPTARACDQCGCTQFIFDNTLEEIDAQPFEIHKLPKGAFIDENGVNRLQKDSLNKLLYRVINVYCTEHNIKRLGSISAVDAQRRVILLISALLNVILISLCFFHICDYIPIAIGIVLLFTLFFCYKFNTKAYITKQIKSRPDEKFDYVIASVLASAGRSRSISIVKSIVVYMVFACSFLVPLIVFYEPHFFYEPYGDNYYVRFYSVGVVNSSTIEVPSTYRDGSVVGLRGDVFMNVHSVRKIILPDTITCIRGKAFMNADKLEEINIPDGMTYIGGSAFKDCISLRSIIIPDSVVELHGECFYNCRALESVKLSNSITEIRGNTFECCYSLKSIVIPDKVTRIAAHAFCDCHCLEDVKLSKNLTYIGSSAFRRCYNLEEIILPIQTNCDSKSFKESPTRVLIER